MEASFAKAEQSRGGLSDIDKKLRVKHGAGRGEPV